MNRVLRFALSLVLCAAPALAQGHGGRHGWGAGRGGARRAWGASRAQYSYVRPRAPRAPQLWPGARLRPRGARVPPRTGFGRTNGRANAWGRPSAWSAQRPSPQWNGGWRAPDHGAVSGVQGFARRALALQSSETRVNHPYWHDVGGMRYAHWYDGRRHWYGFYNGPQFYWTRYDDNRWWWYDQGADRWLYWHDNYWWWNNPNAPQTPYVVIGDSYYPYDETLQQPAASADAEPTDSSDAIAAADSNGGGANEQAVVSPDSTREVQIYGERREAFLYDRSSGEPQFLAYLAPGVKSAQFSESTGDKLQVLLLLLDGTYDVFDAQGRSALRPVDGAPSQPSTPGVDAVPADAPDMGAPPTSPPPIPAQ
ncbi:MAG: hypothetical protein HKL90_03160 [Elusimicrobia bacterium]|nr:hypothetical protein [Elusimicrobiota bacterium]